MDMTSNTAGSRWDHYFLRRGNECSAFWKEYLSESRHKILFILGSGFDPRMCYGIRMLMEVSPGCVKECLLVEYNEGENSPSLRYNELVKKNFGDLSSIIGKKCVIQKTQVPMWSPDKKRRIGTMRASEAIQDNKIVGFTDIIVDISSMPRGIYFPIIAKILFLLDTNGDLHHSVNLHVLIPEQISLDKDIQEEGIDNAASYMHGFTSDLVQVSSARVPKIWIPVLGEGKQAQLIRIYDHVAPNEICPVFPSPSVDPRRADELVAEYRELLFDRFLIEPTNFIYASEWNPFEVYRQIYRTIERYNVALEALGKCRVVVSALSSKLLSVGALLAAYEAKRNNFMVGISQVETHGYRIQRQITSCDPELFSLWVAGECYNA
ncbi:MAG TPA: hypothetical protein VM123_01715 [archaeon]|nr:hypothetical protein [archaeon]